LNIFGDDARRVPRVELYPYTVGGSLRRIADDMPWLADQVQVLIDALREARMEAANLRAGIRAALGADADGETDPLMFLRDELDEPGGAVPHGPDGPDAPDSGWWCR